MMDFKELAEATIAISGLIQGFFMRYLDENDGDVDIALALTSITWEGIVNSQSKDSGNDLDRI